MSVASAASATSTLRPAPRKRRLAELWLLLLALIVGAGAYALVGLGIEEQVPADLTTKAAWLVGLAVAAHVAVRLLAPYADPVLLPAVVALNGLGLALIYRIDLGDPAGYPGPLAGRQLQWTTVGVALFVAVLFLLRDHRRLQTLTYTAGLAGLGLLLLPLMPGLGTKINGAQIWVQLGPLNFQPGEVAKICLVVFFAGYLVVKRDALALAGKRVIGIDLPRPRDLGPILVAWVASLGVLVFERDLGSSLLFFGLFVVLLYVATERFGWVVVGTLLFAAGAWFGYTAFSHVRARVTGWLDPFSDPDQYYQIVQALYGFAWGGLLGRGLGEGQPDLVPYVWSDFIIAAVGEELGLAGLMAVLMIYALIVERGLRTSLLCRDTFGKLVAVGLAATFALQVFVVVGGVTRLIPLTGLTTPFLSYGGSSLVANWAIIALLLRISDQARRPPPAPAGPTDEADTQVVRL